MITIDATGATSGIDFEEYIRGAFLSDVTSSGYPVFDNSAAFSGEEMLIAYGSDSTSKYVLAHGSLEYNFSTHTVAGTINTIEFGTLGDGSYDSDGYFTGGNVELRITGLDLYNAVPTNDTEEAEIEANGAVHNFAAAYMAGSSADQDRFDAFAEALDSEAQYFMGSEYEDVYTGTSFADIIEGNGGDDRLGGGGGDDEIDGGAGEDTAVFEGEEAGYTIAKSASGTVIVTVGEDEVKLTNVEKLEFDGSTVNVEDIAETPRLVIDASGSDGLDFDTYIAEYFAASATPGSSSYHGGTQDGYYGYFNGDQVSFKYAAAGDTSGTYANVVILEGEEIAYDWAHYGSSYNHGDISGAIDSLIFGTITGDEPTSGSDAFTGYDAELVISGFGLDVDPGTGGRDSGNTVADLYYAALDGDAEAIEAVLALYAQEFQGSDGDDGFTGGAYDDLVFGRDGDDGLAGGEGVDVLKGGVGADTVAGGEGDDELFGNGGKDDLAGDEGDDILIGGTAKDLLFGGGGSDAFVFLRKGDSGTEMSARDVIRDFSQDDGDQIDLSFKSGLSFIGKDGFSGDGGEIRYSSTKANTIVKVDFNGDQDVDFKIKLEGKIALAEGDFIL
jgi:Ca2+-binding RTX toxin-like protein